MRVTPNGFEKAKVRWQKLLKNKLQLTHYINHKPFDTLDEVIKVLLILENDAADILPA
jgi:hypothetical protein